jgi:fucose 4-O-acetylase-like acetyltransferase
VVAASRLSERDGVLDCLKGLAIILVVAGHTAQGSTTDFDNLFAFRAIYSFHMPMFMFVAGMVIAVSLRRVIPVHELTLTVWSIANGIPKRVFRLLVPFFAWGIISLIYPSRPEETLGSWLEKLVWTPDYGLWFLPALFDCYLVVAPCLMLAAALLVLGGRDSHSPAFRLLTVSLSLLVGKLFLDHVPGGFAFAFAKVYFPFVALGFLYQMFLPRGLALSVRIGAWVAFLSLMPFWYRLDGFSFLAELPRNFVTARLNTVCGVVVALSGTSITIDIARLLDRYGHALLRHAIGRCGQRSLEIYALHFYFLGYRPMIGAPIALSLMVSLLLRNVPILGVILFGEVPLWQGQILRRLCGHPVLKSFAGWLLPARRPESSGGAPNPLGAAPQAEEHGAERPAV